MRYIVYLIAIMFLVSTIVSCGQAKDKSGEMNPQPSDTQIAKEAVDPESVKMADFPETILTDIKERLKQEGITLLSLKRNQNGESGLIEATIKEENAKSLVPKAFVALVRNFSSLENIKVVSGLNGKSYSLSARKISDVIEKCEKDGGDVNIALWDLMSGDLGNPKEKEKDKGVQAAGI